MPVAAAPRRRPDRRPRRSRPYSPQQHDGGNIHERAGYRRAQRGRGWLRSQRRRARATVRPVSLAIEVDDVTAVLLAGQWTEVKPSTFRLDAYEYLAGDDLLHGGG